MFNKRTIATAVGLALVLAIAILYFSNKGSSVVAQATPSGHMLAESYDPYVRTNGGYYTALPIRTTSDITAVNVFSTGITVSTLAASTTELTTLKVGTNGSSITKMLSGTCNLTGQGGVDTIVASGIATSSCAATGVALGDKVFVTLNSTSSLPIVVQGASASTTDVIKVILYNATSSASQVTAVGTSTAWWVIKSN